jgi:hypothetical protein
MFGSGSDSIATSKKDYFLWGLFYLVAQGGILLIPNVLYWDDWTLYRVSPEIIFKTFREAGSMFNFVGYQHVVMLAIGPWIYKILTFILMFASGLLLNAILERHEIISKETRFYIVLLFLILPFNMARVALIDFGYILCYFLFFYAWLLMDRHRIVALALFFLSFNTNSLLVFYALPILDALSRNGHLSHVKAVLMFGIRRIDFMLLPFVYFFIKTHFYAPSGFYEGYNQGYNPQLLIDSAEFQYADVFKFIHILRADVGVGLCLLLSVFAFLLIKNKPIVSITESRVLWWMPMLGVFAFLLGVFPYWILYHPPTFSDWSSRNQLLMPLGVALVIIGILSLNNLRGKLKNNSIVARTSLTFNTLVISIIIGASLAFTVSTYAAFFVDWQKQKQLMHFFSNSPDVKRAGLIIFQDNVRYLNVFNRTYRFYELNGLMEASFGNEKRFGIIREELNEYTSGSLDKYFVADYRAGSYRKDSSVPSMLVEIDLVKPQGFREEMMGKIFPNLTFAVSEVNLATFPKK